MAELIAQGTKPSEQWRHALTEGEPFVLGRGVPPAGVSWDPWISHEHAELMWRKGRLRVQRLPAARNPLFLRGQEVTSFDLGPGDLFVIGRTVFTLRGEPSSVAPGGKPVMHSRSVSPRELQSIPYRDAPHKIDVLNRLPEVISKASDEAELAIQLGNMLLAGIPHADVVGLVCLDGTDEHTPVRVLYSDRRRGSTEAEFKPSRRLVRAAIRQMHTVLHVWAEPAPAGAPTFTLAGDVDWAFCTPVRNGSCTGWGIYVTGRFSGDPASTLLAPWGKNELDDDLKFAELVAEILSSVRQVQALQRQRALLSQFFSPAIQHELAAADPETKLKPRETDVTVLFCDLRGFSRKVEAGAQDLLALLERISLALGVMTQSILEHRGVVADFLGDAALGFWGWPVADVDMVLQACQAALGIRNLYETFARRPDHPLADFKVGIGIATGRAVAGKIGTPDQAKVAVFGPIVNLASRLEGMTKILHVPIVVDENTAQVVRERMPRAVGRARRLARVKPFGLDTNLMVSELLPSFDQYPALSDEHLASYEAAVDAFLRGDWSTAYSCLHQVPPHDLGKDFITEFIIQNNHTPPAGWDGVIALSSKR